MWRLSQVERVSAARGMHGWLQRPSEPGDRDAPLAQLPVAQEHDNQLGPGKGIKRASEEGRVDGAQRQQKRHKATKDAEGGRVTAKGSPPPHTLDTPLPEREPRSGFSAPSPAFSPPI